MRSKRRRPADELVELAAMLLLIQGVVAAVATVEIGILTAAMGGITLPSLVLTGLGAVLTLSLPRHIHRRSRRARKTAVLLQVGWLVAAAIDLALAIALARRGLEIVPTLVRLVLPLGILRILRRPQVRPLFGVRPSRRDRRRAAVVVETAAASEPAEVAA